LPGCLMLGNDPSNGMLHTGGCAMLT
jgi:hypothetical protein